MKKIKQKYDASNFGGFSDSRVRFFILGFMTAGIVMATFLGAIASFALILFFGIFTAVKANEIQSSNRESMLRHYQKMDILYNYGVMADYYKNALKYYEKTTVKKTHSKTDSVSPKTANKQMYLRLSLRNSI